MTTIRRTPTRATFKHYSPSGLEYCSGRIGWPSRKTPNTSQVTCGNCLRLLLAAKKQADAEASRLFEGLQS